MGHYQEQDRIIGWSSDLTNEEREARRPVQLAFGVGRSREQVAQAVARAREAELVAGFVRELVEMQAVFALSIENASVRDIAAATGISKSQVGRLLKEQARTNKDKKNVAISSQTGTSSHELVREAWEGGPG
jgi:DNA invertase Pin-like site-specific DNA recombinase